MLFRSLQQAVLELAISYAGEWGDNDGRGDDRDLPEDIYVNLFTNVELLDPRNRIVTGVTADGSFLVKNGKIDGPVKNVRFADSPWFIFNQVLALGVPARAPMGYTANGDPEQRWQLKPIIVPPMMVRDFNFTRLADAV